MPLSDSEMLIEDSDDLGLEDFVADLEKIFLLAAFAWPDQCADLSKIEAGK